MCFPLEEMERLCNLWNNNQAEAGDEWFQRVCRHDIKLLFQDKQNGGKDNCVHCPTPSIQHWHDHVAKSRLTEDKQRARDRGGLGKWHSANEGEGELMTKKNP